MLNFGWGEIVLIGIVALIAIGPKELPTVLRSVGQMMAKVRRMAGEFQGQFQEALREAEVADLKKQAEELTSSVKSQVTDFTKYDPLAETKTEVEKAFDSADAAPVTPVETGANLPVPAGEAALPPPSGDAADKVDLAKIDVPMPEITPPRTEDFLDNPAAKAADASSSDVPADKKAGGAA